MSLFKNLEDVKRRIRNSALKVNRNPDEIKLIAVTKTCDIETIKEAINLGITCIGENKIQDAERKFPSLPKVEKHMIGHLQSNKIKKAVNLFDMIESVDSLKLAGKLNTAALKENKIMSILVQVNICEDEAKYGLHKDEVEDFVYAASKLEGLRVEGLMTMEAYLKPYELRPYFREMKQMYDSIKAKSIPNTDFKYLSMGMTNDFEVAIEEGANIVRIGRAIFGSNP